MIKISKANKKYIPILRYPNKRAENDCYLLVMKHQVAAYHLNQQIGHPLLTFFGTVTKASMYENEDGNEQFSRTATKSSLPVGYPTLNQPGSHYDLVGNRIDGRLAMS